MRKTRLLSAFNNINFLIGTPSAVILSEQYIHHGKDTKKVKLNYHTCSLVIGSGGAKPVRPPVANYAPIIPIIPIDIS